MIRIHTLGASHIDVGRNRIEPASFRSFALLLHLSAERKRPVLRTALQELIFPDKTERRARHSLREVVYTLRRSGVTIKSDGDALAITDRVRCDYAELIARARPDDVQVKAAEGGFLPGYSPTHSEAFAEWFDGYRARAIFGLTKALLKEVHRARSVADWGATERAARACLALDALNEEATLALAEVLALGGSKAKAVKLLDDYMAEVGTSGADLRVSAGVLKRRIAERVSDSYRPASTLTFVGREEEMLRATECFQRARAGERQCLVIGGEPGIGKSRLASELQNSILLTGAETRRVTMQPHDARRPLSVFMELVPQLLQMRGAIGCSPESLQLLKRLTERQEEPAPSGMRPEALAFLSTALERAIRELVEAVASETCLSLFIDDAQWLDETSVQTIVDLVSARDPVRLLVVVATRDHRGLADTFRSPDNLCVLLLRTMGRETVALLVSRCLADMQRPLPETAIERVVSTAAGNPFFALLLVRDAIEPGRGGGTPTNLIQLLARRLFTLDDRSRVMLAMAAAFGRHCTLERLSAALEFPRIDLLEAICGLSDAGLLRSEDNAICLGHPLVADALDTAIDHTVIRGAHHSAARVLELEAAEQRSTALYWDSADLWLIAGDNVRAHSALLQCAQHAIALGQPSHAVATLERACDLKVATELLIESTRALIAAADLAADAQTVVSSFWRLKSLGAHPTHDDTERAFLTAAFAMADVSPTVTEQLMECVSAVHASPSHRVWAATWLLKYAHIVGKYEFIDIARSALDKEDARSVPETLLLEFDLIFFAATQQHLRTIETARRLAAAYEQAPKPTWLVPQINLGLALWFAGAASDALTTLKAAYEVASAINSDLQQIRTSALIASMLGDLGEQVECEHWLERARKSATPRYATTRPMFNYLTTEVDVALYHDDIERALRAQQLIERAGLSGTSQLRVSWYAPTNLRLRVAQGRLTEADEAEARELLASQKPVMTGINDYATTAAAEVLAGLGKVDDAQRVLRSYLTETRMGRHPPSRSLQRIAERLGVSWANARWDGSLTSNESDVRFDVNSAPT